MRNLRKKLINLLGTFTRRQMRITKHARERIRSVQRPIREKEVYENLLNPRKRLEVAVEQEKGKYDLLFTYSKRRAHRYVIAVNSSVRVVTAMKLGAKTLKKFKKTRGKDEKR